MKREISVAAYVLCVLFCAVSFFSCASMQVKGKEPAERALSAASLLLEGKTGDAYIKVYKTEMAKAELFIADMLNRAKADPVVYADIADNVDGWTALYSRVELLQKRYGTELHGKKESVRFNFVDYEDLRLEAPQKAVHALYEKALSIVRSSFSALAATKALPLVRRAKKYASDAETQNRLNVLGADICYEAAESIAGSEAPADLLQAASYYAQAAAWIPAYKDSIQKNTALTQKAAHAYIQEGAAKRALRNYTAFRHAKEAFLQAEKIIPGSAAHELADINQKLTVKIAVVFGGLNTRYPDEQGVRRAIEETVARSTSGPDAARVSFIRETGRLSLLFADFADTDLILIAADDFGTVKEVYGPVETVSTAVSVTESGIVYTGHIIEQRQSVTVFLQNDTVLYDVRGTRKKLLAVFQDESYKSTRTFSARIYEGAPQAKPAGFDPGALYSPGAYTRFFPDLRAQNDDYAPITQSFGTLNDTGKRLCRIIANLQYEKDSN